jgi:hypothetical protein
MTMTTAAAEPMRAEMWKPAGEGELRRALPPGTDGTHLAVYRSDIPSTDGRDWFWGVVGHDRAIRTGCKWGYRSEAEAVQAADSEYARRVRQIEERRPRTVWDTYTPCADDLVTADYLIDGFLYTLWPPCEALNRSVLFMVPVAKHPGLVELLGLTADEPLVEVKDSAHPGPHVVLGLAGIVPDNQGPLGYAYAPVPWYRKQEAARLTRLFAQPRPAVIEKIRHDAEVARQQAAREAYDKAKMEAARAAAVEKAALEASPRYKIGQLEAAVRKMEADRAKEAAERAAALEARLRELEKEQDNGDK